MLENENGTPTQPEEVNPSPEPQEQQTEDVFANMFKDEEYFGVKEEEPEAESTEQKTPEDLDKQQKLDENSFRYWQSVADKRQNELEALRSQVSSNRPPEPQERTLPDRNPSNGQFVGDAKPNESQGDTRFPDPPSRPTKPRSFSRIEANNDDNSDSARYMEDLDQWRNDVTEYNSLRMQFSELQRENQWKAQQEEDTNRRNQQQAYQAQQQKMSQIVGTLRDGYQASDDQIKGFISEMSNQKSISVDNLWKLYAINHGIAIENNPFQSGDQTNNQPSGVFQQTQLAQSVPNPMGVMPADRSHNTKSDVDMAIDEMIRMETAENPLG